MTRIAFPQLPFTARAATFLSMFMAWVLFAEFVIDRHGLDRLLPFYRVGNLCPYELAVGTLLLLLWIRLHRAAPIAS
jgi:hypothetical protein